MNMGKLADAISHVEREGNKSPYISGMGPFVHLLRNYLQKNILGHLTMAFASPALSYLLLVPQNPTMVERMVMKLS